MKRKRITKPISLMLVIAMFVQMIVVPGLLEGNMEVQAASDPNAVVFEEDFSYQPTSNLLDTEVWDVETIQRQGTAPTFEDGVMKFSRDNSVQFNWTKVDGVGAFNASNKYVFEFDITITDWYYRTLYMAPGGYWNQVVLPEGTNNGYIRVGDTYTTLDVSDLKNQKLHIKTEWLGTRITSTLTDEAGKVNVTGFRTKNEYLNMTLQSNAMTFFVLRCETGAFEVDNFEFKVNDSTLYSQNFETDATGAMFAKDMWDVEPPKSGITWTRPEIENGVLKMDTQDSLQFFWWKVPGAEEFDSKMTYTFEFDAKITDDVGSDISGSYTRVLFVAPDGWYNQIGLKDGNGKAQVGESGSSAAYNSATYLNQPIHIKLEWKNTTIKSTITNELGEVIATGSRTNNAYADVQDEEAFRQMKNMVIRCEDGAVEIDNFKFTKEHKYETAEQGISIPESKQAVYECDVTYTAGSEALLEMSGKTSGAADASGELFKISDAGMAIGGYSCSGEFGEGTYGVKIQLNPTQKAAMVEVTLPNGGVIRRGADTLLYKCTSITKMTAAWREATAPVTDVEVTYEDINSNDYELNTTEPVYEGFEANVYNLVTAFDVDAKTTRTFAWTALEEFIGDDAMAVQYRVKGASEWQSVDAVKEAEKTEYETEDYFKADITGLTAGTTYEYRIGKKNSTDESNDWGKIYTFTTEAENVNDFSFVAIGDTQGSNWNGTVGGADTRGYMYAQAALNQAVAEVGNPAFILHTGDITEHGTKQTHWNGYFKALGDLGKTIPHFAAIGNHDVWSTSTDSTKGSADNFDLHFNHPNNGGSAAFAQGTVEAVTAKGNDAATSLVNNLDETTYSFNYGNTHFVVLNTGEYDSADGPIDKIIIEAQTEWLINDLEANKDAEWTILMMHEPLYHRLEAYNRLEGINQVIEEYGVDLAILGHSHLVTRTYPMKDGQIVSKAITDEIEAGTGTVYSTIGATTPSHDAYDDHNIMEYMHTTFTPQQHQPTYTTVSVNAGEIKVTIKQIDGLVVDEFVIFKEAEEFSGVTLELGGKIGVNFYVPSYHKFSDEAYVEFELEDGEKQTVSIKGAVETKHGVKFTCWVPAKEMADTITATIYDGGEVKDTISTSVRDYAEILISGSDTNAEYAKAKSLINAMLNYGAYAQKLFDYNTDDLANKNAIVIDNVAGVEASALAGFAKEKQGLENFGYLAGTSLILRGETKLKMFFEFEEGVSLDGLTFSIDGLQQEYTRSGNYYVVEIADISAHLLDEDYTVTVTAGNQSFDAVTSVMTGCYNALTNTEDTDLHSVARALYLYNQEADAYRNGSN